MRPEEIANLTYHIAKELRDDGRVIEFGQEYDLVLIDLWIEAPGAVANSALFYALNDGDPVYRGEKVDVPVEEAADVLVVLLKRIKNWRSLAIEHDLTAASVIVKRSVAAKKRYLFTLGEEPDWPDDPLIVF